MNQIIFEQIQQMQTMNAQLVAQNKLILEQMGHQAALNQPQPGRLPSQPEVNPKGEVNAITLRSGTYYQGSAKPTDSVAQNTHRADSTRTVQNSPNAKTEHPNRAESTCPAEPVQTSSDTDRVSVTQPVQNGPDSQGRKGAQKPPPYRLPVPFPQRLAESRLNKQFTNFIQVLKQLHITIPFTDALTQIPTCTKFLKDILTNKRSFGGVRR